jgi:DNA polymerase-3 subunit gamma/tau
MSYQVLARKWRPKNFATMVGQEHVVKALTHALEQQRLHHAYLFTGTRGVGKTTIARILAKSLNCEKGVTADPCGVCSACTQIDAGRYIDYIEMDAASNRGVDEMVDLLSRAAYAPSVGRYKVYMIDEVHQLSTHAFNAMLKTLEEPPAHILFILATTDPQKVPVTVLSRCLQFNLKQLAPAMIAGYLKNVMAEEKIPAEVPALALVAQGARGSMRDALSLLDQAIAYSSGNVTEAAVQAMLGTIDRSHLFAIIDALESGDAGAMIAVADQMEARSLSFDAAMQELATLLHRITLAQMAPEALSDATPDRARIIECAGRIDAETLQLYYQIAIQGRRDLPLAPDEYAGFTMALLRMAAFRPETPGKGGVVVQAPKAPAATPGPRAAAALSAPVAISVAAPAAQAMAAAAAREFDGDWTALARILPLSGLVKQLAQHAELKKTDGETFELVLPAERKTLADPSYQKQLNAALSAYLGKPCMLRVEIGAVRGDSVAALEATDKRNRQQQAVASVKGDDFVKELVEGFDATIVESSIKPLQ